MPKVFSNTRNKNIRARTVKTARSNMVSIGGILMAAVLFVIGVFAYSGGYMNVGPIFVAFGALVVFISVLPAVDMPGWATAVIVVGAFGVVVIFSMPYVDAMVVEFNIFIDELPARILDWIIP